MENGDAAALGADPEAEDVHGQGFGWANPQGKSNAENTVNQRH